MRPYKEGRSGIREDRRASELLFFKLAPVFQTINGLTLFKEWDFIIIYFHFKKIIMGAGDMV